MCPRTVTLLVGVLCVSAAASPQDQDSGSSGSQVNRKYDRFQDETTISVKKDLPEAEETDTVVIHSAKLIIEHTCKGDVAQCPPGTDFGITFFFINIRMSKFQNARITFRVDGARVPATKVLHDSSVLNAYQIMETVSAITPSATLRKIATVKAVEVQIGTTEFALSDESMAAFRAISQTIKAGPPARDAPRKSPRSERVPQSYEVYKIGAGLA